MGREDHRELRCGLFNLFIFAFLVNSHFGATLFLKKTNFL